MTRILFISDHGGDIGGGERSMLELVSGLLSRGYEVFCILPNKGVFYNNLSAKGVVCRVSKMMVIDRNDNPFYIVMKFFHLILFGFMTGVWIRRRKIDLIHVNKTTSVFHGLSTSFFAWRPLVWHVRNYNRRFGILGRIIFFFTDKVICISKDIARPFHDFFKDDNNKINTIHNGVVVKELPKVSKKTGSLAEEMSVNKSDFIVGVAGRFTAWKKYEVFLDAFKIISEKKMNIYGVIAGDCVSSNNIQLNLDLIYKDQILKKYNDLKLEDKVKFVGFKKDPEAFLKEIDVFVCTSNPEPFGRVIIEAMAVGVPVVAVHAGGVPEIVLNDQTGILVSPDNPEELSNAIIQLYYDPMLRRRYGKAGWERAKKHFSTSEYVDKVETIYKELLS